MPLFYYVSDSEKDALQKPLDAERLLRMLGASGKLAGFRQTAYMIEQAREHPECVELITKRLYRDTARVFHTSSNCVERNLRTVIQTCWRYPDHSFLNLIMGIPLVQPPTNTQLSVQNRPCVSEALCRKGRTLQVFHSNTQMGFIWGLFSSNPKNHI